MGGAGRLQSLALELGRAELEQVVVVRVGLGGTSPAPEEVVSLAVSGDGHVRQTVKHVGVLQDPWLFPRYGRYVKYLKCCGTNSRAATVASPYV